MLLDEFDALVAVVAVNGLCHFKNDLDGLFALGFVDDGVEFVKQGDGIEFEEFHPVADEELYGFGVGGLAADKASMRIDISCVRANHK